VKSQYIISIAILALLCGLRAADAAPVTLIVAPNGKDTWSGLLPVPNGKGDGPLATLAAARDKLRRMKKQGRLREGAVVLVRGGTYLLSQPLAFGPEDSGTAQHPVVYMAWPEERVIIGGGQRITGWKPAQQGLWTAPVPNIDGKPWRFRQLFVNGKPQPRSRHPNTDNWHEWPLTVKGFPHNDKHDPAKKVLLYYPEGALIKNWPNLSDVEINILAQFRWVNAVCPLKSVDEKNRLATLATPAAYHINKNDPFRVENVVEAIDEPGEWCLNTLTRTVTILPPKGVEMAKAEVIAPVLDSLVRIEGTDEGKGRVRHFILRGFEFAHAGEGVVLSNVESCRVENCRFIGLGGQAITARNYVQQCLFTGNEAAECGGGGIALQGYPPGTKDVNRKNVILGNHIHHCGRIQWNAAGISLSQSGENLVRSNYVHNMPYIGISGGGVSYVYFNLYKGEAKSNFNFRWEEIGDDPLTRESVKKFNHTRYNLIEGNIIHTYMQQLEDGGGVYLGFLGVGNVVRNNLVFDTPDGLKIGIYMDDEADAELIEGNVVFNVARVRHNYRPNVWRDNHFFDRGQQPPAVEQAAQIARLVALSLTGPRAAAEDLFDPATGLPRGVRHEVPQPEPPKYDVGLVPEAGGVYLSDLKELASHAHIRVFKDEGYGGFGPLQLGNKIYKKGLVMHPLGSTDDPDLPKTHDAEAIFDLGALRFKRFRAIIGVHTAEGDTPMGSVTFEVYIRTSPTEGWKKVYDSGVITHADKPRLITVDIAGAWQIRLRTTDAGDDHFGDVAVWATACVD